MLPPIGKLPAFGAALGRQVIGRAIGGAQDAIRNTRAQVVSIIAGIFVGLLEATIGVIGSIFAAIDEAIVAVGQSIVPVGELLGSAPYLVIDPLRNVIFAVAGIGGPLSPLIVAVLWAVMLTLTLLLIRVIISRAIGVIPVL